MKRVIKRAVCLLLVLVLCVSVSGCKELDRARAHHATIQEDGSLLLDGKTYLALPYCPEFTPPMGRNAEVVTLTEADVPVLLKDFFYDTMLMISEDKHIIGGEGTYFCLEEDHEELLQRIEAGYSLIDIRYTYYEYSDEEETYVPVNYVLSEVQKNAVRHVAASVEPRVVDSIHYDYGIELYSVSEDGWFSKALCDVCTYNGQYALVFWSDSMVTIFDVPTELSPVFEEILHDYIQGTDVK